MSPSSSQAVPNASGLPLSSSVSPKVVIGMIGLGTVGSGVFKIFRDQPEIFFQKIAVKDASKTRTIDDLDLDLLSQDPHAVVNDPETQVIVELMGGAELARDLVTAAIRNGKHVVTANKELIAKHGPELFELARQHNVRLLFEGAVAGGIPIIMPLKLSLGANRIQEIAGILNGTTNYILTKMTQQGWSFEQALQEAQAKGFAEADPTNDVEGFDVGYKISVLSLIAFKQVVDPLAIHREGITHITAEDIENARELGYVIKLIGLAKMTDDGRLDIRVHPMLIPNHHPLSNVQNEFNAIFVKGDAVGDVMFYGRGAGEMPTASAVAADILAIATGLLKGNEPIPSMVIDPAIPAQLQPVGETVNKYYLRLNTKDKPKVIGHLGNACGDAGVSLESVMQKGINPDGTASIVLLTQAVREDQMNQALSAIRAQESTRDIGCLLRVL
ncbi:homoserine dehydrogenase [Vampirovibrio chlorellavorus]|uniref:homoserine dehydrogenase n=1 Tax=Vampirovibrio chlorellavorus TaxID=758823 RepID=UPI0026EFC9BB|nr:homoserine dehydrogenase [Vampirovibrio chlorellavorus]